ncbi:MAG: Maf family protein [Pseudomonadota bacterium]
MTKIILASKSASRAALLAGAGVKFVAQDSAVDETIIKKQGLTIGLSPADIALRLAEAKALACGGGPDWSIGGDQVLEFEGQLFDKPKTIKEAADRLEAMAGRPHHLRSGLVLAKEGAIHWRHQGTATLHMRDVSRQDIDTYLETVGPRVLSTVGAYELEGPGVRLFDRIEGDYFTILGLSLLPLLDALRQRKLLPW